MNDDRFEDMVREAGRDYHRPPETPREEMWAAIDAERRSRRAAPRVIVMRPAWRWGIGMAAVLLIGIAIGRVLGPKAPASPVDSVVTQSSDGVAYRLAAAQYLGRTEALLAGFRSDAPTGVLDQQFVAQARDLLSSTRLLLDSPAGNDPQLKPLLEDLELVLAQIARLPARPEPPDVYLIDQALDQREVISRLRVYLAETPTSQP